MSKIKCLYVEDEAVVRRYHVEYLKSNFDMEVFEAVDGRDGYSAYKKYVPDFIITDISMPNMCGLELIKKIREDDLETKIVVFSAYSDEEKLLKAIPLQLFAYKLKPIKRKDFLELVVDMLRSLKNVDLIYFDTTSYFDSFEDRLVFNDIIMKLNKNELKLLKYFLFKRNVFVESVDIFNHIWDFSKEYKVDSVRTLIKKLRKKLPPQTIENIYGGKYKLITLR